MIFFPAKNNLLRRGVVPDTLCPICTREEEIAQHALWSCPSIQDVWGYGPKKLQKGTEGIQNFTKVFDEYLMERCDLFKIELIVVVAQKIWFHIYGVVYGEAFIHPQQVFREASLFLYEFWRTAAKDLAATSSIPTESSLLWQSPPTGMYKVNWDAAVDQKNERIGIGIVVRNHEGVVLAERSTTKSVMVKLVLSEVLVGVFMLWMCKKMSFIDIILERDTLQIVNVVKAPKNNWSKFEHIIDGIKVGLCQLRFLSIDHVMQNVNTTIHTIVKETIFCVINRVCVEKTPNYICGIISRERYALR
jgi:hypothetical protein